MSNAGTEQIGFSAMDESLIKSIYGINLMDFTFCNCVYNVIQDVFHPYVFNIDITVLIRLENMMRIKNINYCAPICCKDL